MQNHRQAKAIEKYSACVAMTMSLAACSSAGNVRNSASTPAYTETDGVSDVASCVSSGWATKPLKIAEVALVSGTSLQLQETDNSPILALVDITSVGDHTITKYYSRMQDDDTWDF